MPGLCRTRPSPRRLPRPAWTGMIPTASRAGAAPAHTGSGWQDRDMSDAPQPSPYDALLLLSFGGPEGPDDVLPFLENVTRGPRHPARAAEGGRAALLPLRRRQPDQRAEPRPAGRAAQGLRRTPGSTCPSTGATATGRRTSPTPCARCPTRPPPRPGRWPPAPTPPTPAAASTARTSPTSLAALPRPRACALPRVDKLRHYFNHPGFLEPVADGVLAALGRAARTGCAAAHRVAFTTHSIPTAGRRHLGPGGHGDGGAYVAQHLDAARPSPTRYASATGVEPPLAARLPVPQRRPAHPLAGAGHLRPPRGAARRRARPRRVMVPIGFVSDHMEVKYDLDTEAAGQGRANSGCR